MPKVEVGDLLEARHDRALSAAPERRVSEQLITEWEQERRRLRHALALMTLRRAICERFPQGGSGRRGYGGSIDSGAARPDA